MHFPEREAKLTWNLNTLVTLGGVLVGIVVTSTGWGITLADMRNQTSNLQGQISDINNRLAQEASDRKERLRSYQEQIAVMQQQIGQIPSLQFQATRALEASAENKKTIEDLATRAVTKLESLGDQINRLSSQVQVLGAKFDDLQSRPDHTIFRFRTPISAEKDSPARN